jgi:hypothetical protein
LQEVPKEDWKRRFGENFGTLGHERTHAQVLPSNSGRNNLVERVQDEGILASPLLFPFSVQISIHGQDAVWSKAAIQLDVATEPSLSPC